MTCPHCGREVEQRDRYAMAIDPDAPGFFGLLVRWSEGERGLLEWIAAGAVFAVVFFALLAAFLTGV